MSTKDQSNSVNLCLSGIYPGAKFWAMVYHIDPGSEMVEFVGIKGPKFFRTKQAAEAWFHKKHGHKDYIDAEAVEFTGFNDLKVSPKT
jgi:hypothetical protein